MKLLIARYTLLALVGVLATAGCPKAARVATLLRAADRCNDSTI